MYQPYPSGHDTPATPDPGQPPKSVTNAVKLMYAGAAVSTVSFIVSLTTIGGTKAAIRRAYPDWTAHKVDQLAQFVVVYAVVFGIIGIALWLWMARKNAEGRTWARVTSTVLFAFNTIGMYQLLREPKTITIIFPVLVWVVGLGAIILLWQPASSAWFTRPGR